MSILSDFLSKSLPWLGAAVSEASPLGLTAGAIGAIGSALGLGDDASHDDILKGVASATAEQKIALKQAEMDFQARMQEMGFKNASDLLSIDAGDRKDARAMQVSVRSWTPAILSAIVTVGFFGILGGMMAGLLNAKDNQALLVMLGSLGTGWTSILNFYFGSSAGSARKDELLHQSTPKD